MKSRTDFIADIHKNFYYENINDDKYAFNYPIIFLKHDPSREMSDTISEFRDLLSTVLPDNCIKHINYSDTANLIDTNNHYEHGLIFFTPYNKLYDFFVEKGLTNNDLTSVYRIEGDSGKGIYQDLIHKKKSMSDHFDFSQKTPPPMEDGVLKSLFGARLYITENYQKEWFFAFKSKEEAMKWFDSENGMMDYIVENGNPNIVEYKVENSYIISTKNQTAFRMINAEKIDSKPFVKEDLTLKSSVTEICNKHKRKDKSQLGFNF
jgi:hypothetical protein